jgi:glycosyltransferase involved in cell wall biosynthesis
MLIIISPAMQSGFYGFLNAAIKRGYFVATNDGVMKGSLQLRGIFWDSFLYKFNRDALWIPNPIKLLKLINKHSIKDVHVVGEPTYMSLFVLTHLNLFFKLKINISCRTAQNVPFKLTYFPFKYNFKNLKKQNLLVFAVSPISFKFAENFYKQKNIMLLPNGVPEEFYKIKNNLKKNNRRKILFIGTFLKRKGVDDFIKLSEIFKLKYDFIMIGADDASYSYYKQFKSVRIYKRLKRSELISFLDESIILVVPSKYSDGSDFSGLGKVFKVPWMEQFGRVIIEAYSRGCEVVAYNSGAIKYVIRDKKFLANEGDIKQLNKLVLESIKNYNIETIRQIINYSKSYKWETVFQKFLDQRSSFF